MDIIIDSNTRFIFTETSEYPLTFQQIKQRLNNVSFPSEVTYEMMAWFNFLAVLPVTPPTGDVVTEGQPFLRQDGYYEQTYEVRAFTPEEHAAYLLVRQNEELSKVTTLRLAAVARGVPVDFGAPYGVQYMQLRDGDRVNILGLRIQANAMIAAGDVTPINIRTYENLSVPLTPQKVIDLSWSSLAGYQQIMGAAWDLQDLIRAAESLADLPVLPESLTPAARAIAVDPQYDPVAE